MFFFELFKDLYLNYSKILKPDSIMENPLDQIKLVKLVSLSLLNFSKFLPIIAEFPLVGGDLPPPPPFN